MIPGHNLLSLYLNMCEKYTVHQAQAPNTIYACWQTKELLPTPKPLSPAVRNFVYSVIKCAMSPYHIA